MVRRLQFPKPLAEAMGEFIAWTVPLADDENLTVWCFPAANLTSQTNT